MKKFREQKFNIRTLYLLVFIFCISLSSISLAEDQEPVNDKIIKEKNKEETKDKNKEESKDKEETKEENKDETDKLALKTSANSSEEITTEFIPMSDSTAADYFYVYDPFEGFNRRMYFFNYYSETYVIMPIVTVYKFILPDFMESGVSNFYDNSRMIPVMGNSILQTKGRKFMRAVARFSINTVIGIFGLFDVASKLGMPKDYEDFGLTLQHYGVPKGPFLILPIFGPSFLRDAPGVAVDAIVIATTNPLYLGGVIDKYERLWFAALYGIDLRKRISFNYYGMGTPFEYEYIRFFYHRIRTVQEVVHE